MTGRMKFDRFLEILDVQHTSRHHIEEVGTVAHAGPDDIRAVFFGRRLRIPPSIYGPV